jgi:hypothetical protein
MLRFERDVVSTLTAGIDEPLRADVEKYVDEALHAMPEHLRAGMIAESLALGAWARLSSRGRGFSHERLDSSQHDPLRQYVRLLRSHVQFAEHENPLFAEHELPAGH